MATGIKSWSTTAGDNDNADSNINWLENQAPSTVNNSARAMMKAIRDQYEQTEWRDWGHTVTQASATTFTIAADVTSIYVAGRTIKCVDSSDLYGVVASSSFSSPNTTVTVTLDSGSLSASLTSVELGPEVTNPSIDLKAIRGSLAAGQVLAANADATKFTAWAPKGHIAGLTLSNDTDTDHDINVTSGEAADSGSSKILKLTTEITKQIDATWAAGDDAGGLSSSLTAPANNTWYHVFLVEIGGSVDVLFDTSITCANGVSDHSVTNYQYINSVLTDGSANILPFDDWGDGTIMLDTPIVNISNQASSGTASSETVSTPLGIKTEALLVLLVLYSSASTSTLVSSLDNPDVAPGLTALSVRALAASTAPSAQLRVKTNTSSQVRLRSGTGANIYLNTHGWRVIR